MKTLKKFMKLTLVLLAVAAAFQVVAQQAAHAGGDCATSSTPGDDGGRETLTLDDGTQTSSTPAQGGCTHPTAPPSTPPTVPVTPNGNPTTPPAQPTPTTTPTPTPTPTPTLGPAPKLDGRRPILTAKSGTVCVTGSVPGLRSTGVITITNTGDGAGVATVNGRKVVVPAHAARQQHVALRHGSWQATVRLGHHVEKFHGTCACSAKVVTPKVAADGNAVTGSCPSGGIPWLWIAGLIGAGALFFAAAKRKRGTDEEAVVTDDGE